LKLREKKEKAMRQTEFRIPLKNLCKKSFCQFFLNLAFQDETLKKPSKKLLLFYSQGNFGMFIFFILSADPKPKFFPQTQKP